MALTFGSGAMTNSIADMEQTDLFFMIGSNPDTGHPTIGLRVHQAVDRGAKLVVVDPRRTKLAERADLWLRIKPGTDVALLNGMMNIILEDGVLLTANEFEVIKKGQEAADDLAKRAGTDGNKRRKWRSIIN